MGRQRFPEAADHPEWSETVDYYSGRRYSKALC